jgi:hypothetical protein
MRELYLTGVWLTVEEYRKCLTTDTRKQPTKLIKRAYIVLASLIKIMSIAI